MLFEQIKQLVEFRNYLVGGDELNDITSYDSNSTVDHILCTDTFQYDIWTSKGEHIGFKAMDYEEAKRLGLVKIERIREEATYE